jgi:hypothetical protein
MHMEPERGRKNDKECRIGSELQCHEFSLIGIGPIMGVYARLWVGERIRFVQVFRVVIPSLT